MKFHRHFFLSVLCLIAVNAQSQVTEHIHSAVEASLLNMQQNYLERGMTLTYDIQSIDSRLNLAECPDPIEVKVLNDPLKHARTRFEASCHGAVSWRIYISANVIIEGPIVVVNQTLGRNITITEDLLSTERTQINKPGYAGYTQVSPVLGMITKRSIRRGQVLQPHMLKAPLLVKRGDKVILEVNHASLNVRMTGLALNDGQLGQEIAVKNERSQRVVRAKVVAKGVAQVTI